MNNVLVLATRAPYGSIFSVEGFLAAMAIASMDIPTNLVLMGEGIYCGLKGQKPDGIGHQPIDQAFGGASEFNISLYIHKESMDKYGVMKDKLVDGKILSTEELKSMVNEAKAVITF